MNKNEFDCQSATQDRSKSKLNSFQSSSLLSSSRIQKIDQSTITDHLICQCSCEMIPKLKEKAHKAFMQVFLLREIENLYKEELDQLKEYYEDRQKNQNKKFLCKELMLQDKCKELQQEIQKIKEVYHRERVFQFAQPIQSPFVIDSIDTIMPGLAPDDSCESIYEFINTTNLQQNAHNLKTTVKNLIGELRKITIKVGISRNQNDEQKTFQYNKENIFKQTDDKIQKIFQFMETLIENTVTANQKFNEIARGATDMQTRYNKIFGFYESNQKQTKFMTEHIKRLSQDNLTIKRKFTDSQKVNRILEEQCKELKKSMLQKGILIESQARKRQSDAVSSHNIRHEEDPDLSRSIMLSTHTGKRVVGLNRMQVPQKLLPLSLNFKKKGMGKSQQKP